jgi:preprotein translocase subunit SecA
VQDQENRLTGLRDEQLLQTAEELRGRLLSMSFDTDQIASAFALAREAARRHTRACAISTFSCSAALQ